jgi:hypothetical protein
MTMDPLSRTAQVRLRFEDPERKFVNRGLQTPFGDFIGLFSFSLPSLGADETGNEITMPTAPGRYDLLLYARSRTNDLIFAPVTVDVGSEEVRRDVQFTPGIRVNGSLTLQDSTGKNLDAAGIVCGLYASSDSALNHGAGC